MDFLSRGTGTVAAPRLYDWRQHTENPPIVKQKLDGFA